jgi:hypothetical protein
MKSASTEFPQLRFEQLSSLLRSRRWTDALLPSSEGIEPIGPVLFAPLELNGPAEPTRSSTEMEVETNSVRVQLGATTPVVVGPAALRDAVSVGRATVTNRDLIVIQTASVELLLTEALERLKQSRPNSGGIPELERLLSATSELRNLLSGMPPADAIVGAKALSIRDGLVSWWTHEQVSSVDRSFNMGLFAGGLVLCAQFGLVPAVTVARLIRGRSLADALGAAHKSLSD